tara:strand:+ start:2881 stop:3825 length:945 start_codon:yes stop_codon:yes gene_type:complete
MNAVFLMDPLEGVIFEKDTTLALMIGAHARGYTTFFLPEGGITLDGEAVRMHVEEVEPRWDPEQPFVRKGSRVLEGDDVDVVFVRTEPPFDEEYLAHTWMLDRLPPNVVVLNTPAGLRAANEKLWALQFQSLIPRTMVSRNLADLRGFMQAQERVIVKPTDGFGGKSVFLLAPGDVNAQVTLETLTEGGRCEIVMQRYVPEAAAGDKRILLLNGEPLGAVLRVHGATDHRNNFFSGGRPEATELTDRDREIVAQVGPRLRADGLPFVGIDVLGDYLIEVNVTSPTCLQEMNRLYDVHLEDKVIDFVDGLIRDRS